MYFKKDAIIYLLGELFSKLTPFLLLPIVSRQFGTEGVYLYTTFILLVFISQSLLTGWLIPYLTLKFIQSQRTFQYLYHASNVFLSRFSIVMLLIVIISFLILREGMILTICVAVFGGATSSIFALYLCTRQYKRQSKAYVASNVFRSSTYLGFCVMGVYYFNLNVYELMLGHSLNSFIHGYLSSLKEVSTYQFKGRVKASIFKYPFKYGAPLLPGIILNNVRTGLDRFLLGVAYSATIVGLYAASYQLASIVMVLSAALTKAIGPVVLRFAIEQDTYNIRRFFLFFCFILTIGSLFVFVGIEYFGVYILGEGFNNLHKFSLLPFLFLFQGISGFFVIQFQAEKKTSRVLKINLVSMLIYSVVAILTVFQGVEFFVISIVLASFVNSLLTFSFGGKKMLFPR